MSTVRTPTQTLPTTALGSHCLFLPKQLAITTLRACICRPFPLRVVYQTTPLSTRLTRLYEGPCPIPANQTTDPKLPSYFMSTPAATVGVSVGSAPLPYLRSCIPCKRKAVSIPVSLEAAELDRGHTSSTKHVSPLIVSELLQVTHQSATFPEDFLLRDSWDLHVPEADFLLAAVARSLPPADGVRYHENTRQYTCTPPAYTNTNFAEWFCRLANAIRDANNPTPAAVQSMWVYTKDTALTGARNGELRPDFILTVGDDTKTPKWNSILVVGKHQSKGSKPFTQLARYAEQVFIAQPFRTAVLGILTSNISLQLTFWRFDRAGAIGSMELDYQSTSRQLGTIVRCLYAIPFLPPEAVGFHVSSIITNNLPPENPFPLNDSLPWKMCMSPSTVYEGEALMNRLLFVASGIVTRGTRVWLGTLGGTLVAIKYSWRSSTRPPEASLYQLAASHHVIGLATLVAYDTYEDIATNVRFDYCLASSSLVDRQIKSHNRHLTRLILTPYGRAISDENLSPSQVAKGLFAGLVGHASLYFDGGILHRDLSPQNIIYTSKPQVAVHQWILGGTREADVVGGTMMHLYGALIDLDYAVELGSTDGRASGAADRIGTYPFIAMGVLGNEVHRYRHDLESFLYVLLWVCCYPVTPDPNPKQRDIVDDIWPRSHPLKTWIFADEQTVTTHKGINIVVNEKMFEGLLRRFRAGFEGFKAVARRWRRTLWGIEGSRRCTIDPEGEEDVGGEGTDGMESARGVKRGFLLRDEVRVGVANREAFGEARDALRELVEALAPGEGELQN
ncbi:hypothetical protein L211DRAFT_868539 [Terfezia boudieri ATCC MYA-4762]|uniref:Fungal-type protein kinase domain-containing protein n=1 Tax=Terfezia boudieri ATCC MYA-4762 TaxID=1051890 RepID=A0A3N4LL74_9PEZI|nr:hypothetical protein L211DRAFT_868539 [Terfezia boudieri ATCC MYA-4762]